MHLMVYIVTLHYMEKRIYRCTWLHCIRAQCNYWCKWLHCIRWQNASTGVHGYIALEHNATTGVHGYIALDGTMHLMVYMVTLH